jgi:hypothetical protein
MDENQYIRKVSFGNRELDPWQIQTVCLKFTLLEFKKKRTIFSGYAEEELNSVLFDILTRIRTKYNITEEMVMMKRLRTKPKYHEDLNNRQTDRINFRTDVQTMKNLFVLEILLKIYNKI